MGPACRHRGPRYGQRVICHKVMFAKEHQTFIKSEEKVITFENLSYVAKLNNYSISGDCYSFQDIIKVNLSLLFIIKPENNSLSEVILPYYIATLNSNDDVLDIQYYATKKSSKNLNLKNLHFFECLFWIIILNLFL